MIVQRLHENIIVRADPVPDYWSSSRLTNRTISSGLVLHTDLHSDYYAYGTLPVLLHHFKG